MSKQTTNQLEIYPLKYGAFEAFLHRCCVVHNSRFYSPSIGTTSTYGLSMVQYDFHMAFTWFNRDDDHGKILG